MSVREKSDTDAAWIAASLQVRWGGTIMVVHGETIDAMTLLALVAGEQRGLPTYRVRADEAELVALDAAEPGQGAGTHLPNARVGRLRHHGVCRLWVTTANDNLAALAFYQRRGFRRACLRPGAVDQARRIKPGIPLLADNGIPIRDEIDLCREPERVYS